MSTFNLNTLSSSYTHTDDVSAGLLDPNDYYKFTVNTDTLFNFSLTPTTGDADLYLYQIVGGSDYASIGASTYGGLSTESINTILGAGDYMLSVSPFYGNINYTLDINPTVIPITQPYLDFSAWGMNNTYGLGALTIGSDITTDMLPEHTLSLVDAGFDGGPDDTHDGYSFTLANPSTVTINLNGDANSDVDLGLYDIENNWIKGSSQATGTDTVVADLPAGTYWVDAALASTTNADSTATYDLSWSAVEHTPPKTTFAGATANKLANAFNADAANIQISDARYTGGSTQAATVSNFAGDVNSGIFLSTGSANILKQNHNQYQGISTDPTETINNWSNYLGKDPATGLPAFVSQMQAGSSTTGDVFIAVGDLVTAQNSQNGLVEGDAGYLAPIKSVADMVTLSFDFTTTANTVDFNLMFGSEEFPLFANQYVDGAIIKVDGINFAYFDPTKADTLLSVTQANVDAGYFHANSQSADKTTSAYATEFNGISDNINVLAPLDTNLVTHNITISIADTNDHSLDSAIFLTNLHTLNQFSDGDVALMRADATSRAGLMHDIAGASSGSDVLVGGDTNDYTEAGDGNDGIDAGNGNDIVAGDAGDDTVNGGEGNDYTSGGTGDDTVDGGAGDDNVSGGDGRDDLFGGEGDDVILSGDDTDTTGDNVDGGTGNDTMTGASGDDTMTGGTGTDSVEGGAGNDEIVGGTDSLGDNLDGGTGNDTVTGGTGSDTVSGGDGRDILFAGAGDDVIVGGDSTDTTGDNENGGAGNDTITGAGGDDTMTGGTGTDSVDGGAGNDKIVGGTDSLGDNLDGGTGDDSVTGGTGNDTVSGGDGRDELFSGAGDDVIVSGDSTDTTGDNIGSGAGNDGITGAAGDDTINAGTGNDSIDGGAGDDSVIAGTGNDTITTDTGADTVNAGAGNDIITGGTDTVSDTLVGGDGKDTVVGGDSSDSVNGGAGDDSVSTGTGADTVDAGAGNDVITGGTDTVGDSLVGGLGNDSVTGGASDDTVSGGDGSDNVSGDVGNDTVSGGNGNDTISGGDGSDNVSGGVGNDTISGGDGNDTVSGGAGQDDFMLTSTESTDTITDFSVVNDTISFDSSVFTGLTDVTPDNFVVDTAPDNSNPSVIYDSNQGSLSFDDDGAGPDAPVEVAIIGANLGLTSADFIVV